MADYHVTISREAFLRLRKAATNGLNYEQTEFLSGGRARFPLDKDVWDYIASQRRPEESIDQALERILEETTDGNA